MNIKVIPILVLNLIKENPIKLIALAVVIITFPFLNSIPDVKKETPIFKEIKIDGEYVYLSRDVNDDGKINYEDEIKEIWKKKLTLKYIS